MKYFFTPTLIFCFLLISGCSGIPITISGEKPELYIKHLLKDPILDTIFHKKPTHYIHQAEGLDISPMFGEWSLCSFREFTIKKGVLSFFLLEGEFFGDNHCNRFKGNMICDTLGRISFLNLFVPKSACHFETLLVDKFYHCLREAEYYEYNSSTLKYIVQK